MSTAYNTTTPDISTLDADTRRAARAERHACFLWTSFILLLLGGSISMWIYAAVLAVSDPSMAVVPDYHEKALQWDQHLAIEKASRELGWTIAVVPGATVSNGQRELTLFVRDAQAQPVHAATGSVRLYHHARGKQVLRSELTETDAGAYRCTVDMHRAGTWHIEVTLQRGQEHVEQAMDYDLEM